jgi:hypothetical protein
LRFQAERTALPGCNLGDRPQSTFPDEELALVAGHSKDGGDRALEFHGLAILLLVMLDQ